jgi:hypothetical protein
VKAADIPRGISRHFIKPGSPAAAEERALLSIWAAAEALVLETLPSGRAREFYEA